MSIHEVLFPIGLQYGSEFGASHNVAIIQRPAGVEQRTGRWANERRIYNGAQTVMSRSEVTLLRQFWRARGGSLYGFLLHDPTDYASTTSGRTDPAVVTNVDQILGTGDGVTTDFQLTKRYTDAAATVIRNIERPKATTVLVAKDVGAGPVAQTLGVNFTVGLTTGIVSFAVAPAMGAALTCGFQNYVIVRFGNDSQDQFRYSQQGFDVGSADVPLIELFGESSIDDDAYYHGGSLLVPIDNRMLDTAQDGGAIRLQPAAACVVRLPLVTSRSIGGPHFCLWNDSAFVVTVMSGGSTVGTLAAGAIVEAYVFATASSKTWKLF